MENHAGTMKNNIGTPCSLHTHEKTRRGRPPGHQTQSCITNFFFQIR
jgi:hypothetical protein